MNNNSITKSASKNQDDTSYSIQKFDHPQFSELTVLTDKGGKIWFIGNEIAGKLEYARPKDAVSAYCKGAAKHRLPTAGGMQDTKIIPEPDFYRLVMRSEMPKAEDFQDWVCEDVLPAIRKTGKYEAGKPALPDFSNPAEAARAWADEYERAEQLAIENKAMLPKAQFVDEYVETEGTFTLTEAAKTLKIKRKDLIEKLQDDHILFRRGHRGKLEPYATAVERGLFEIKTGKTDNGFAYDHARLTPKGVQWVADRYLTELAC